MTPTMRGQHPSGTERNVHGFLEQALAAATGPGTFCLLNAITCQVDCDKRRRARRIDGEARTGQPENVRDAA